MSKNCGEGSIDLSFRATEAQASAGIADFSRQLLSRGVPPEWVDSVKIAVAEAINNVVEHAYAGPKPGMVNLKCRMMQTALEIQIVDKGAAMPGLHPPDGIPPNIVKERQHLPEGGFGWFMIHQLTSGVIYKREDGINRLCLTFDFADPP
ncbi:MAG: ATP-binding protein [Ruegeria sp.]